MSYMYLFVLHSSYLNVLHVCFAFQLFECLFSICLSCIYLLHFLFANVLIPATSQLIHNLAFWDIVGHLLTTGTIWSVSQSWTLVVFQWVHSSVWGHQLVMMDWGHANGSSQLGLGSPVLCLGQTSWNVSQCSFKQGWKKHQLSN